MKNVVFITGTSTGFGKLTTNTLSNAGYEVIAGMRDVNGRNAAAAKALSALPNVEVTEIDVSNDRSVNNAFKNALQKYAQIDVLINNAAVMGFGLLEAYSIQQIKKVFETNFYGVVRTCQAVLPSMRLARQGLIINITSGASGHTMPFMIPYLASKFGVESITEGLQDELREYNIENVSIQPGVYPTEMGKGMKPGVHADKSHIIMAYGDAANEKFNAIGAGLFGKMNAYNMDPQTIADGILALIKMKQGTRPLRYPLDAIAEGTDHEFINARAAIKEKWLKKYSD